MRYLLLLLTLLTAATLPTLAQGCSDAGVCTIRSFKNNTVAGVHDNHKNELVTGFAFGKGERSTSNYTPYAEYTRNVSNRTSLTAKISYSAITGELANTAGFSDLLLTVNHAFDTHKKWMKSYVVGIKLPLNDGDIMKRGIHLPMPYQSSLGTTDLVVGVTAIRRSFGITIAVQQPLTRYNGNKFLPEEYSAVPLTTRYFPSNEFGRKGDALLRLSYKLRSDKKLSFRPSLLSIYHLGNDTYLDAGKIRREITASSGLTVNGNVFIGYALNKASAFELSLGTPFIIRTNRPDGLTRSFVSSLEYRISF